MKRFGVLRTRILPVSLLTQERGLKQSAKLVQEHAAPSLLTQERGLKQRLGEKAFEFSAVAPHAGARIETA